MAFQNIALECRGCGATISMDPTVRFGTCPYCGNCNSLVPAPNAPEPPAVEQIYPANYSEDAFRMAVRSYLCSSPDVPDELYESLEEREFTLNFWPFYRHTIQWTANWTADIGYPSDEAKDGVNWAPGNGQALGSSVVYAPAASVICNRGLGEVSCRLAASNESQPYYFQPELFNGVAFLGCDVEADAVESGYVSPVLDGLIEDGCIDQLPGDYQKNLHYNHRIDGRETVLQMIPYWLFVYDYKGESYYVMQNAVTGEVAGSLPKTSRRKLISWALTGCAFVLSGLFAWILSAVCSPYDAAMFGALCFPTLAVGFIYREIIARQKSKMKAAPLSEMHEHLVKLKKFEKRFIHFTGLAVTGWCIVALLFTLLLSVIIPVWRDPYLADMPEEPKYPGQNAVEKIPAIRLKLEKVAGITEEISSDDGDTFVIEQ